MNRNIYVIFLSLAFCLIACRQHPHIQSLLQEAETLMGSRPDSSLILLESIPSPEKLSEEDYATWCLLITQARDKNYVEHTSDSVIGVAVRYFEKENNPKYYAKALYYQGRIYQDLGNVEKATSFFINSLDVGKRSSDYLQLFLTSSRLGTLYARFNVQKKAMVAYHDALQYALASQDSSSISYGYSYMGRAYSLLEEWEQSLSFYEKALFISTQIKDLQATELAMNEYVAVCANADRFDKIADYVDKLLEIKQDGGDKAGNLERLYFTIGDLFRHIGRNDESVLYLKKALLSDNLYTLAGSCQSLYFLYEELEQYENAVRYNNKYWEYADSIQKMENNKAIMEIETKYNHEKIQKENLQLRLKNVWIACGGTLGLLAALGFVFTMVKIFRRQLKDKEKFISDLEEQLEELKEESLFILSKMERNHSEVLDLSEQLEKIRQEYNIVKDEKEILKQSDGDFRIKQESLSQQLKEKADKITQIEKAQSMFIYENKKLEKKNLDLKEMIGSLQKNIFVLIEKKNLDKHNVVSFALLIKMRNEKKNLRDEEWKELFIIVNLLHENFVDRLLISFPKLKNEDLKLCCLTKLQFTNEEISSFLCIQEESVIKRKQRFKSKIGDPENWGKGGFDVYIASF